jgi:glycosyltransferase involved in cell wall biosynthesis
MEPLSVFVTTYNNARTLGACLESVKWADEIILLDSFSGDATLEIAQRYGCVIHQHTFLGYGAQKQSALEKTTHRWVLLLDADEMLTPESQAEIRALLAAGPSADGYTLPRQEQMFWRMGDPRARMNHFLRLFDKTKGRISTMPIHAAPQVQGRIERLRHPFFHFGETSIHIKVEKVNGYSTGLVADKQAKGTHPNPWVMLLYPPLAFVRNYLFKGNYRNGWAGFIAAVIMAFYAFMKYAKLYEAEQFKCHGDCLMPPGAPPMEGPPQIKG